MPDNKKLRSSSTSAGSKAVDPAVEECGYCQAQVRESEKAVICDLCEQWFHVNCDGLSETVYKAINADKKSTEGLLFYCRSCRKINLAFKKQFQGMQLRQDKMDREINELKQGLNQVQGELRHGLNQVQGKIDQVSVAVMNRQEATMSAACFESMIAEVRERSGREDKIVLYNVPEKKRDILDCQLIVNHVAGEAARITIDEGDVVRLGRAREENDRPRPILVKVKNRENRDKLVRNGRKVRDIAEADLRRVFVARDLTKAERAIQKGLRDEYRERKAKGEDVAIRGNKVIVNDRNQQA